MYRNCIFCSADLGRNEALERFPVGARIAFDAWRGRLWAVCPKCARWNLAALEERWEPVEDAERRFRDARLRVQSENVGLAKLPDGTRLIRVGRALPGELAAWRYGDQLVRRRNRYLFTAGAAVGGVVLLAGGAWALGFGAGTAWVYSVGNQWWKRRQDQKVLHRVPAEHTPFGRPVTIRRWHALGGWLEEDEEGISLHVPDLDREHPRGALSAIRKPTPENTVVLPDADARAVLGRTMVHVNRSGASRGRVQDALAALEAEGSAEAFVRKAARTGRTVGKRGDMTTRAMATHEALALEMALHDEAERRAMEGELAALEAAWRQAEEIAEIADVLPDDPLETLKPERA